MKKTKINLLVDREDYKRFERYFFAARIMIVFLIVVFLLSTTVYFILSLYQNKQINQLLDKKQALLQSLQNHQSSEAQLSYIEDKYKYLTDFLKDDAYSLPYYNLLSSAIGSSTGSAIFKSFDINKNRETNFVVSFSNFNDLMNYFRFVESDTFLKNFETVVLKSFTTIGVQKTQGESYELDFTGRFIPIKSDQF